MPQPFEIPTEEQLVMQLATELHIHAVMAKGGSRNQAIDYVATLEKLDKQNRSALASVQYWRATKAEAKVALACIDRMGYALCRRN